MPWCSFPWHKLLPRLTQKNCYTFYSLSLIHEFTSLFRRRWFLQVLPRKAFPGKQAKVDSWRQCFSVVAQAAPQDSPKASPMAIFKWKNLIELNLLSQWTANTPQTQYVPLRANIASHQLCRERQPSLCGRAMMALVVLINAMVFVSMAHAPPKAGSKDDEGDFFAGLPRKAFPLK